MNATDCVYAIAAILESPHQIEKLFAVAEGKEKFIGDLKTVEETIA